MSAAATDLDSGKTTTLMRPRTLPWFSIATEVVDDVQTSEDALRLAGLDWNVELRPLYFRYREDGKDKQQRSTRWATVRTDTWQELGIVGKRYEKFDNRDAFKFLDELVDSGAAKYQSAGSLGHGSKVFVVMRVPQKQMIMDDEHESYILFITSHDGSMAVTATTTTVRLACTNMFRGVVASETPVFRASHLTKSLEREVMVAAAQASLGLSKRSIEKFEIIAEGAAEIKVDSDDEFERIMRLAFPWENKNRDKEVAGVRDLWHGSPYVPETHRYTGWGLLNATTEYMSHYRSWRSGESRFKRALGVNSQIESRLVRAMGVKAVAA